MNHKLTDALIMQLYNMFAIKLYGEMEWKIDWNETWVEKFPHNYNAAFPAHFPVIRKEARS